MRAACAAVKAAYAASAVSVAVLGHRAKAIESASGVMTAVAVASSCDDRPLCGQLTGGLRATARHLLIHVAVQTLGRR